MTTQTVGVIGLGRMGAAMARRLSERGFAVTGCDTSADARAAVSDAVTISESPDALAAAVGWIILSLPSSREVEAVVTGEAGLLTAMPEGASLIDTSSSDPDSTKRLAAEARARGIGYIDAPVSGGPAGAAAGTLAIAVGGSAADLRRAYPPLEALAARVVHVGDSGAGHTAKIVNNLLCASHLLADGAALRLGRQAGVDPGLLLEAVNGGSGRSAVTEAFMPKWILPETFDSGFTMALMLKDLRLARDLAARHGGKDRIDAIVEAWEAAAERLGPDADFTRVAALAAAQSGESER